MKLNNNGGSGFFPFGADVEVCSREKGSEGAWFPATILEPPTNPSASKRKTSTSLIIYKTLVSDEDPTEPLVEHTTETLLRPAPPADNAEERFEQNDTLYLDGWRSGVVMGVGKKYIVALKNPPIVLEVERSRLRSHWEWDNGIWTRAPRKDHGVQPSHAREHSSNSVGNTLCQTQTKFRMKRLSPRDDPTCLSPSPCKKLKRQVSEDTSSVNALPNGLLAGKILSLLPIRDAVRTCVICKEWRELWKWPVCRQIVLDETNIGRRAFQARVGHFISHFKSRTIYSLTLHNCCRAVSGELMVQCIDFALERRVQILDINLHTGFIEPRPNWFRELPVSTFLTTTLDSPSITVMRLKSIWIKRDTSGLGSLKLLQILQLCDVKLDQGVFEELLCVCSRLTEVTLIGVSGVHHIVFKNPLLRNLKVIKSKLCDVKLDQGVFEELLCGCSRLTEVTLIGVSGVHHIVFKNPLLRNLKVIKSKVSLGLSAPELDSLDLDSAVLSIDLAKTHTLSSVTCTVAAPEFIGKLQPIGNINSLGIVVNRVLECSACHLPRMQSLSLNVTLKTITIDSVEDSFEFIMNCLMQCPFLEELTLSLKMPDIPGGSLDSVAGRLLNFRSSCYDTLKKVSFLSFSGDTCLMIFAKGLLMTSQILEVLIVDPLPKHIRDIEGAECETPAWWKIARLDIFKQLKEVSTDVKIVFED